MSSHRAIDRRTFLRASGVAMALPLLESMNPAIARAAVESPKRMVNICTTLGLYADSWFPKTVGEGYEATEYLKLIDEHRNNYTVFSGYSHKDQSGRQPHNSEITWLTSARRPGVDGFRNTISVDQVAANHLGYVTRFPSIVLGTATPMPTAHTTYPSFSQEADTNTANISRTAAMKMLRFPTYSSRCCKIWDSKQTPSDKAKGR